MRTNPGTSLWISRERFRGLVAEALDGIPQRIHASIANVEVVVEDEPGKELVADLGYDPGADSLFGLYQGVPLDERGGGVPTLPDRIVIYYLPLIDAHRDEYHLRLEVRRTVIHELGHYFGFDDHHLRGRGF
ncbi:MAG: metallopeptidase family protein [Deltaproteobacteria bacterium]